MKPSWDEYFLNIATVIASRSPDPKYNVGAVVVSADNRILGTGYNGFVSGFDDNSVDWNNRDPIRPYIIHAEANAILHTKTNMNGAKIYITLSPCKECIKLIAAAGIREIVFRNKYKNFSEIEQFCTDHNIRLRYVDK